MSLSSGSHVCQYRGMLKAYIVVFFVFQLALKHRQGKNHRMRIVAFVGSPVEDDEKEVHLNIMFAMSGF